MRQHFGAGLVARAIWITCLIGAGASAGETLVGQLGDPARLTIQGSKTFPAEQIRLAIARDMTVQITSSPTAKLDRYLTALQERVKLGLTRSGLPDATVRAARSDDNERVILTITEGKRYVAGRVKVSGAGAIPVDALIEKLTTKPPILPTFTTSLDVDKGTATVDIISPTQAQDDVDPDDAAWTVGDPVDFTPSAMQKLTDAIRRELADLGFFRARFVAKPVPAADGTAELAIDVADVGERATVARVSVAGLVRNSAAAVVALCGIREGEQTDLVKLRAAQQALWDCGRFIRHRIVLAPVAEAEPSKCSVNIEVDELPELPTLDQAFSKIEQATLRCRDYLARLANGGGAEGVEADDIVVELHGGNEWFEGDMAFGFSRGVVVSLARPRAAGALPWFGGAIRPGIVSIHNRVSHSRVSLDGSAGRMKASLFFGPTVRGDPDGDWALNFSAGMDEHILESGESAVRVTTRFSPAAFVWLAHEPRYALELTDDGIVRSTKPGVQFRIDAASGRPIEIRFAQNDGAALKIRFERGAVRRTTEALDAENAAEMFDSRAPVGSLARFGLGLMLDDPGEKATDGPDQAKPADDAGRRRYGAVSRQLLSAQVTEPLDRLYMAFRQQPRGKQVFKIPVDLAGGGPPPPPRGWQGMLALYALPYVDDLFPRASWPWTVSREMLLVMGGRPSESAGEVSRVFESPATGPMGYAVSAALLARANSSTAGLFARRGLRRATPLHFAQDWDALIGGDKAVPQFMTRLLHRLGELPPADVATLASTMRPSRGLLLTALADAVRSGGDDPKKVSKAIWDAGLGSVVEGRLKELSAAFPEQ